MALSMYHVVSPKEAYREGTSGGNVSSSMRKHLANAPLAGNSISTRGATQST